MKILRSIALIAALVSAPAHAGPIIIARPVVMPRPVFVPRPAPVVRPAAAPRSAPIKPAAVARQTVPTTTHSTWSWLPFWVATNAGNNANAFARNCRKVPPARRSAECIRAIGRQP